jgi:hypothetical protein
MHREGNMACRGVHFALTADEESRLLSAQGDAEVMAVVEAVEETWDNDWFQETDKAWDAIHRCLTDGTLSYDSSTPLHKCILGGRQLHEGDDYIVAYLTAEDVRDVAAAIGDIDEGRMRRRYDTLSTTDYGDYVSDEDFEYTWSYFEGVQSFFRKAAESGRAVIFTVDQ